MTNIIALVVSHPYLPTLPTLSSIGAIPCHCVVGSDGSLRGYRWGCDRKRALLEREATQMATEVKSGEFLK